MQHTVTCNIGQRASVQEQGPGEKSVYVLLGLEA